MEFLTNLAVAVLDEAIDEGGEAGGVVEDGRPVLVGEVGGDDDGAVFVPSTDDVEEQVGRAAVGGDLTELIEDEQVGAKVDADGVEWSPTPCVSA